MATRKVILSVAVDPELVQRLNRVAKAMKMSRSRAVQELLERGIDDTELVAAATTNPLLMGAFARAMNEPGVLRSLVGSMKQDLTDDQLGLFSRQVEALMGTGIPAAPTTESFPPSLRQNREGGKRRKPRGK